jgi:predicted SAM-dependent methyltransferase
MDGWIEAMHTASEILRFLAFRFRRATWGFRRRPFPQSSDGQLLIHIGSGPLVDPRFVNIDIQPYPSVHILGDGARLDFPDNSIDLIYASHTIEHFSHREIQSILSEWHRVLKPGGRLFLSVPDFEKLAKMYTEAGIAFREAQVFIMGSQGNPFDFHKSLFDRRFLTDVLADTGFDRLTDWEEADYAAYPFDDYAHYPPTRAISLNLKAAKRLHQ